MEILITLPLEEHILPNGKQLLLEKQVKHRGIWSIHLSDADPWPSDPHGDRVDGKEKLNLLSGEVYDVTTRKCIYSLSKKSMKYIHRQIMLHEYKPVIDKLKDQADKITYL